jgi:VanZ family protein
MRSFVKWWLPVILWAFLISLFSTDEFSSSNTSGVIDPIILWFIPHASAALQETLHHALRKFGHWSEYFILSLLLLRAFQRNRQWKLVQPRWVVWTLLLVLLYALIDEWHQSFVPSRTSRLTDSMINFLGGVCAVGWRLLYQIEDKEVASKEEDR